MVCSCGKELSEKAKFCTSCGKKVVRGYAGGAAPRKECGNCWNCRTPLLYPGKFCVKCGSVQNEVKYPHTDPILKKIDDTRSRGEEEEYFGEMPDL